MPHIKSYYNRTLKRISLRAFARTVANLPKHPAFAEARRWLRAKHLSNTIPKDTQ